MNNDIMEQYNKLVDWVCNDCGFSPYENIICEECEIYKIGIALGLIDKR